MTRRDEGTFSSRDGTQLFWRRAMPEGTPRAWVGVVHGYGDHSGRYLRPIEALAAAGLGVLAFDYRGHGRAQGARGDVARWDAYLEDLRAFWHQLVENAAEAPLFLLAHSHGALMATHFVAAAPQELRGVILSAPFYALAFDPPPLKVLGARLVKGLLPGLPIGNELKPEQLSRDPAWQQETAADPLYVRTTTPRWFFETKEAQRRLEGLGSRLQVPTLMLAGTADPIASMPAARAFFETIGARDKTYKEYGDYRHEVLMEQGREQVWADIIRWISEHQ